MEALRLQRALSLPSTAAPLASIDPKHFSTMSFSHRSPHVILLTTTSIRPTRASMNSQTHFWCVFGSTAPADKLTVEHPGLRLGYNFMK